LKNSQLRTTNTYERCMSKGTPDKPCKGIKGRTELSKIFKFPDDLLIDSMHLIYLGIFKTLFKKWFDSTNSQEEFYIGKLN
jgi:hypothetical protein